MGVLATPFAAEASGLMKALGQAAARAARAADQMRADMEKMATTIRVMSYAITRRRDPGAWRVRMAGWEARMYVRGGQDATMGPGYATAILRGLTGDRDMVGLTPAERATLAVAFLEGFMAHNEVEVGA